MEEMLLAMMELALALPESRRLLPERVSVLAAAGVLKEMEVAVQAVMSGVAGLDAATMATECNSLVTRSMAAASWALRVARLEASLSAPKAWKRMREATPAIIDMMTIAVITSMSVNARTRRGVSRAWAGDVRAARVMVCSS